MKNISEAMKNVSYDQAADAAYIRLKNSKVVDSETIAPGIICDYDENEQVVGIELLSVKKRTIEELKSINFPFEPEDDLITEIVAFSKESTTMTSLQSFNIPEYALDRDCTTLSRHVLQQFHDFSPEAQDLSAIMSRIALAGKLIARRLSRAGLMADVLGFTGETNVQGESVKKMDVYANEVFISVFKQSGLVCRLASEEMDKPYYIPENCPIGRYTLLYDPIDGSSNVDINLNVGSIFAIRQQQGADLDGEANDLLQDGRQQIAAGYILYGPSTMLVYSLGTGVHSFILDPSLGEFILAQENIKIPNHGPIYSTNEGNFWQWDESIRDYTRYVHRHEGYTARYSGALVGDIHRILMQGGVFLYPGTIKNPQGKLRLLYETAPLAFLIEQAGGRASDGQDNLLEIVPNKLHQRTPLVIGSTEDVNLVESFISEHKRRQAETLSMT